MDTDAGLRAELRQVVESLWARYMTETAPMVEEMRGLLNQCEVAASAADTLTSTHSSYITPAGRRWFTLKSRNKGKKNDKVDRYFRQLTNEVAKRLSQSNFYTASHEVYGDRVKLGTGAFFIGGSDVEPLFFTYVPFGTFVIDEDSRERVHTLVRKFKYTPAQAEMEWGREVLPEKVQAWCDDPKMRYTQKVEFAQIVRPNKGQVKKGWKDVPLEARAYEGYYVEMETYEVIKKEGFYEFPFLVTRYLKEAGTPYGTPPGKKALPAIRQVVKLERLMDTLAETQAFPRIMQLAAQNKQVDMRAGGITTISEEAARLNMPREWGTGGRYDVGLERIRDKEASIRRAYHEDMLLNATREEKTMTAREVEERSAEKILAFTPSFTLFINDNQVAMRRILGVLMRRGEVPLEGVPEELVKVHKDGSMELLNPHVAYLGRIAQALELIIARGTQAVVDQVVSWVQSTGRPQMLDWIDEEALLRGWVDSTGCSDDIVYSEVDVAEMKVKQEAAAMMQQQAMMDADKLDAAGKLAQIQQLMLQKGGAR